MNRRLPLRAEDASASRSDRAALETADRAMARYAEGHDASFAEVFELVAPRMLRFLRRLSGSDELARDLLQEALLRMHQARGAFRPGCAVLPWAYTIARNIFLDSARARRRSPVSLAKTDTDPRDEPAILAEAESVVVARETARAVERALATMSAARREAFVLIRFEGLSVAEASEILGVSENAVKLRAFQAYQVIRQEMDRLERGPKAP